MLGSLPIEGSNKQVRVPLILLFLVPPAPLVPLRNLCSWDEPTYLPRSDSGEELRASAFTVGKMDISLPGVQ